MATNKEIVSNKQLKAIKNYIETLPNSKAIMMMWNFNHLSGMRCINFNYLQLKDVIKENNDVKDIIELDNTKNKGNKKARYYVNEQLKEEIKKYISNFNLNDRSRYLFLSPKTGKPYNRNSVSRIFTGIYKTFNLDCSTHYGRRNFITNLINQGVGIQIIKTLVNHSNIQTTSGYYNENPSLLKDVVNRVKI